MQNICEDGYQGNWDKTIDKQTIARNLRSAIAYYTELTVEEHMTQKITKEADKAWKKVDRLINKLTKD